MTRNTNAVFYLCLGLTLTACKSTEKLPELPVKPEVIHVETARKVPCPTEIPEFIPRSGSNSDSLDEQHQKYIREGLLPILRCFMISAPEPAKPTP